jgi:serine/threonine protein phosphatase 1
MPLHSDPPGRILAIGDVHGCTNQLDPLWAAIQPTPADTVVFLGDYIDRGPESKGVLDRLIEWRKNLNLICLRGNHELIMQRAVDDAGDRKLWLAVGGMECLASYSSTPGRVGTLDDVPESHWDFIENTMVDYFESEQALFVHATYDPDKPSAEQTESTLFWMPLTKAIVLNNGKTLVCGHSSQQSGQILDLGSTVCIDTFAHGGGKLTCLDVTTWHYWQADLLGRVQEGDLPAR